MRHELSFAITLHRVFDSAPPGGGVAFTANGERLNPYAKPGGLYVFAHKGVEELKIECRGYLTATVIPKPGGVIPVILYPGEWFVPPPGWKVVKGDAPPGAVVMVVDKSQVFRIAQYDNGAAVIRSKNGAAGGMLLFTLGGCAQTALIIEKHPPDRYILTRMDGDHAGAQVQRVYTARADERGRYFLVMPESFNERDDEISEWVL